MIDIKLSDMLEKAEEEAVQTDTIVCWGAACGGNFSAPFLPPSRAKRVRPSECKCYTAEQAVVADPGISGRATEST